MANQRMVNSKFWSDSYIRKLNYSERYLFLYFLTNEHTNIAGIYEITMDAVLFETGLEKIFVLKTLKKLEKDNKAKYRKDWIWIYNFIKNQNLIKSPQVIIGIKRILNSICSDVHTVLGTGWVEGIDTLSLPYGELNLTKLNLTEPLKNENPSIKKEKNCPFVSIDWVCEYTKAQHYHGKYLLFMGKDKQVYGQVPNEKRFILLSEIKKTY
ncbi:MAG TPA: hypothetical protein VI795_02315 [Patescibacteria group bacterium]|nr:hypothetical protein [Patescibacteria group bacterium]